MTDANAQNSSQPGESAPAAATVIAGPPHAPLAHLGSGRARCPGGCKRLSHERGGHVYARHLLACLDCERVWTVVLELTVPRAA